ncbi:hypothetical protein TPAU25S_02564 [Tsukamurella paurometabola]|uniref:Defence against restriction A N-terminal domain-containing protein n=1 Tax=Tsukamurella paurometabola (strain ATCC 8368 / DSM 20162 / CCUG 35730 / CIP 100753 / JCM 10117 / KCTC 9821 / NBRC 16120 / NCIMB 702349 / NCTC 13040) TaxID=521096 RepID=D5URC6_TSUPD|nr:hypothetical protein [Tsukamurella paurometabola]ADG76979.1 conserved hypothetical protein [Tsukamurella paurometabola DSM 20162]SUP42362.1 Uncharacterised protein [Tsukamurella paurometabola]
MAEQTLTAADLDRFAAALAAGKRPTVYLIEAVPSLGLAGGASAKVVEVSGTTVTVRPAGVDDQLPYDARELRATKQPKPVKPATAAKAAPKAAPATAKSVAITVFVGADNAAAVKVTRNANKPAGAREVALPAVQKALAGLGDKEAQGTVDEVLSTAREAAADRVAQLQAELAAAKKSLASLDRAKRGNASTTRGR